MWGESADTPAVAPAGLVVAMGPAGYFDTPGAPAKVLAYPDGRNDGSPFVPPLLNPIHFESLARHMARPDEHPASALRPSGRTVGAPGQGWEARSMMPDGGEGPHAQRLAEYFVVPRIGSRRARLLWKRPRRGRRDAEPIPLVPNLVEVHFPVDALPPTVAAMVHAVAEAAQVDVAMPGVSALTVLAAAAGGRAEIEVRPGWREPLCLYAATVAGPGERKSAVQAAMTKPLLDVEAELAATGADTRVEMATLKQIADKDADRARAAASTAAGDKKDAQQAEAVSMALLAESIAVPTVPHLIADDITPEAAASLLAAQGGRLAIISAESGIFDIISGRYSGSIPSLDLWLKGHSGDPLKVDRKGRDPEYIRRPALTLGLMLQPSALAKIGRQEPFRGRGLLARILYSQPGSKVGHRKPGADPVPSEVA